MLLAVTTLAPGCDPLADTVPAAAEHLPEVTGYRLVRELGRGAVGAVYEATDTALNRTVALKLIVEEHVSNASTHSRFWDEAEAVARVRHPNVVEIYHVGSHSGRPYLALEFVSGGTLADRLKAGPLGVKTVCEVVAAVARAVHHAHQQGVIHRDLKPGNILLEPSNHPRPAPTVADTTQVIPHETLRPKVSDFGLAKFTDDDRRRTQSGMFVGTLGYIAPELIHRPQTASPASDIYALGVILYECLTGELPIVGETFLDMVLRIEGDVPGPPSARRRDVVPALDEICRKALAKNPADRQPSAAAFADELENVAKGHTGSYTATRLNRVGRRVRAHAPFALLCAAALAVVHCALRYSDGLTAVRAAEVRIARGEFGEAEADVERGLARVLGVPGCRGVSEKLARLQSSARHGREAGELHRALDRLRFASEPDTLTNAERTRLAATCDELWVKGVKLADAADAQTKTDLLDLALMSADLRESRPAAAERLTEAENLLGPHPVLALVRATFVTGTALPQSPGELAPELSGWALHAVGRIHMNRGDAEAAVRFFRAALSKEPGTFWSNFHLARLALRHGKPAEAVGGFTVCLGVTRDRQGACYYNRAVAYEALDDWKSAAADLDRALELEPGLAPAAFRRGVVRYRQGRWADAAADLERARREGHAAGTVCYHLALVRRAAGDLPDALKRATEAANLDPTDARAAALVNELRRDLKSPGP